MNHMKSTTLNLPWFRVLNMAKTMGERLQEALEKRGREPPSLISALGVSKGTVYNILEDTTKPDKVRAQTALAICQELGISLRWLLYGEGSWDDIASARSSITDSETPADYVRLDLLEGAAGMGEGIENKAFPEVIRQMDFAEAQLRNLIGFLPRSGRLKLMTGHGISMEPLIRSGDVVIVDTGCRHFEGDGIYVINLGDGQQIKALQRRGDGVYVVSANTTFPPFPAPTNILIGGKIYLRNRVERLD